MVDALASVSVHLETVAHVMEQFGYHPVAGLKPFGTELRCELAHTLACPAQRRFRITAGDRVHERVHIVLERRVLVDRFLASTTRLANPLT
jgi:hypothetical protein